MILCHREGRSASLYEDDDAPHRRKTRKMAFIKLKRWKRRKDRLAGEGGGAGVGMSEEIGAGPAEDHFTVKV